MNSTHETILKMLAVHEFIYCLCIIFDPAVFMIPVL